MPTLVKFALPSVAALTLAFGVGTYVGASRDASAQKLDKWVFDQYVSKERQQYLIDSVNNSARWKMVEAKWEDDRRLWKRVLCKVYRECE